MAEKLIDAWFGRRIMLGDGWSGALTMASRQAQEDRRKYDSEATRSSRATGSQLETSQEDFDKVMVDDLLEGQPWIRSLCAFLSVNGEEDECEI